MNKQTIIEKLENGEYTVEHERYCDCRVEMGYGDAPWTREAYNLLTEAEERMK